MLDVLWITIGSICIILGIVGCFLPVLPGPPMSWLGLLLLQLKAVPPFESNFLILWLVVALFVTALDYIVPVWGTKKFGGTKYGTWGSAIGLIVGVVIFPMIGIVLGPFGLLGIILAPFLGAYIGESIGGQQSEKALIAAFGSFLGFLAGTLMKLSVSLIITYYFIADGIF